MAQKDHPDEGPTLELPSLFRRKKKAPQVAAEDSADPDLAAPFADTAPLQTTEVLDEPPPGAAEPDEEPPAPLNEPVDAPVDVLVEPVDEPSTPVDSAPAPVETAPVETAPVERTPVEPEPVNAAPVDSAPVDVVPVEERPLEAAPLEEQQFEAPPVETESFETESFETQSFETESFEIEAPPEPEAVPAAPKPPMRDRIEAGLPDLAAGTASIVVGAVVGLLGCTATFLSLKGCELATGTSSCGGPGLLVLIVIVVAMILVGALLLRFFRVAEPGNLSFLGVAITAVVILVFLIEYLFSPWMFAVVPVLSALAFAIARWVTTRWTDDGDFKDDYSHDVR